ncbi:MAG: LTA synthase family protein [Nevskia sp.]
MSLQFSDDALCVLINGSLFLLPFLLLLALSGRLVWALSFAAALALFVYGMGELKYNYFGTRLVVGDWEFIAEPANWSIVWKYPRMYGALAAFALAVLLLMLDAGLAARRGSALSLRGRGLVLTFCAVLGLMLYSTRHHHVWEVWQDDGDCGDAHHCGVLGRLMFSFSMFEYEPPAHAGDPTLFLAQQAALADGAPETATKPDIVLWLNESTYDVRNFLLPNARLPKLPMFDAVPQTRLRGPLRTHTFGGKTWLSEFSVLTGLVPDDFGARRNLAFTTMGPKTQSNLFRLLKANGYRTVVLMPTFKRFYGAGRTYDGMGVDEVLTLRDFREYDALPGDEWDIADTARMSEAAVTLIRKHRDSERGAQPIFLYLLSVKEHAPYSKNTKVDYNLDHAGLAKHLDARLSNYIGRMRTLDAAITSMDQALFARGARPVLLTYFGDHQAYYDQPSPPYRTHWPEPKNVTQFQIRANYDTPPVASAPLLDIAFIPSLIADLAGVREDAYFTSLSAMRRLCNGLLDDCADQDLVQSYKARVFSPALGLFSP